MSSVELSDRLSTRDGDGTSYAESLREEPTVRERLEDKC